MSAATVAFILFVISGSDMPDLTALATYPSAETCNAAAAKVKEALATGQDGKLIVCLSADSLKEMGAKNGLN